MKKIITLTILALCSFAIQASDEKDSPPKRSVISATPYSHIEKLFKPDHKKIQGYENLIKESRANLPSNFYEIIQKLQKGHDPSKGLSVLGFTKDSIQAYKKAFSDKSVPGYWILVSSSLPEGMLDQYLKVAEKEKAVLVFRGVPDGMTFGQFVNKYIQPLRKKGRKATVIIDPRAFDLWSVDVVPTIVYAKAPECQNIFFDKKAGFQKCHPADERSYCKVSGAVTLYYAKDLFEGDKVCSSIK